MNKGQTSLSSWTTGLLIKEEAAEYSTLKKNKEDRKSVGSIILVFIREFLGDENIDLSEQIMQTIFIILNNEVTD